MKKATNKAFSKAANLRLQKGFTMVEITVAIAIVAMIMGTVSLGFGGLRAARYRTAVSKLASNIGYLYQLSINKNLYLRLVFDQTSNSYWSEMSDKPIQIKNPEEVTEELSKMDFGPKIEMVNVTKILAEYEKEQNPDMEGDGGALQELMKAAQGGLEEEEEEEEEEAKFQKYKDRLVKKIKLPKGVKFTKINIAEGEASEHQTQVALHFFPNGMTQKTLILIEDRNEMKTYLTVSPLTGKVKLSDDEVTMEQIR